MNIEKKPPPWPIIGGVGGGVLLLLLIIVFMSGGSDPIPTQEPDPEPPPTVQQTNVNQEDDFWANDYTDPNWDPNNNLANRSDRVAQHLQNQASND